MVDAADKGALYRARIEVLFDKARAFLAQSGPEIVTPAEGEFLIGDVPALTMRHDQIAVGLRAGLALGDAHAIVMPLGRGIWRLVLARRMRVL